MLIVLFLVSHFNFLFVPCGGLSWLRWLPVSFLLHVKYTVSYRIVLMMNDFKPAFHVAVSSSVYSRCVLELGYHHLAYFIRCLCMAHGMDMQWTSGGRWRHLHGLV